MRLRRRRLPETGRSGDPTLLENLAHLGGPVTYTGRPIAEAHRAHPIMGGQFARRLTILKETLEAAGVPEPIKQHWLAHTEAQRALVTSDVGRECDPDAAKARVEAVPNAPLPRRKQP